MVGGLSSEHFYIEVALKQHAKSFAALEEEMAAFVPRPAADFECEKSAQRTRLLALNPHKTVDEISALVQSMFALSTSERVQFSDAFSKRFVAERITIALLAHALCEALINAILVLGLAEADSHDLFSLIEPAKLKEKWVLGPQYFQANYKLPRSSAAYETLQQLCKLRNAFTHYKVTVRVNEQQTIPGTILARHSFEEAARWTRRFLELPYVLHRHACEQIENASLRSMVEILLYYAAEGPVGRGAEA